MIMFYKSSFDLISFIFRKTITGILLFFLHSLISLQSAVRSWSCLVRTKLTITNARWPFSVKTVSTRSWFQSRNPRLSRASSTLTTQVSPQPLTHSLSHSASPATHGHAHTHRYTWTQTHTRTQRHTLTLTHILTLSFLPLQHCLSVAWCLCHFSSRLSQFLTLRVGAGCTI